MAIHLEAGRHWWWSRPGILRGRWPSAMFVIQKPEQERAHWQHVTEMLRKQFPGAMPVMEAARNNVLAFLCFLQEH